jgi:hypothetical protein
MRKIILFLILAINVNYCLSQTIEITIDQLRIFALNNIERIECQEKSELQDSLIHLLKGKVKSLERVVELDSLKLLEQSKKNYLEHKIMQQEVVYLQAQLDDSKAEIKKQRRQKWIFGIGGLLTGSAVTYLIHKL